MSKLRQRDPATDCTGDRRRGQAIPEGSRIMILAPDHQGPQGRTPEGAGGPAKGRLRASPHSTGSERPGIAPSSSKSTICTQIEAVVDRLVVHGPIAPSWRPRRRLIPTGPDWPTGLETALKLSKGLAMIGIIGGDDMSFPSTLNAPIACGISLGAD